MPTTWENTNINQLVTNIKKSIDNDEARSFIAGKVFNAYIQAIDFIMNVHAGKEKTVHAIEWINKSRATSLAINLKENAIKKYAGLPDSLLQKMHGGNICRKV